MNLFKKILNVLLLVFFVITIMVPITGVQVHKMVSTLFLILSIVHTCVYYKKLSAKKLMLLGGIVMAFVSGLLGMIFDQFASISILHKAISIASVFFLAIHIFVHYKRYDRKKRNKHEEK